MNASSAKASASPAFLARLCCLCVAIPEGGLQFYLGGMLMYLRLSDVIIYNLRKSLVPTKNLQSTLVADFRNATPILFQATTVTTAVTKKGQEASWVQTKGFRRHAAHVLWVVCPQRQLRSWPQGGRQEVL